MVFIACRCQMRLKIIGRFNVKKMIQFKKEKAICFRWPSLQPYRHYERLPDTLNTVECRNGMKTEQFSETDRNWCGKNGQIEWFIGETVSQTAVLKIFHHQKLDNRFFWNLMNSTWKRYSIILTKLEQNFTTDTADNIIRKWITHGDDDRCIDYIRRPWKNSQLDLKCLRNGSICIW